MEAPLQKHSVDEKQHLAGDNQCSLCLRINHDAFKNRFYSPFLKILIQWLMFGIQACNCLWPKREPLTLGKASNQLPSDYYHMIIPLVNETKLLPFCPDLFFSY